MLITKIREEIENDYADMELYDLYFALRFPETRNVEFDLDKELETLREIRKKEKEMVEWR